MTATIPTRRTILKTGAALAAASSLPTGFAIAQAKPLKVGLMLPYSGTFAQLGENITHAIEMVVAEKGGKLGGRDIQFVKLDDESKPELGPQNADRMIKRDNVDVIIGTVHSGVQMAIHKAAVESGTLCIIPNAGAVAGITTALTDRLKMPQTEGVRSLANGQTSITTVENYRKRHSIQSSATSARLKNP